MAEFDLALYVRAPMMDVASGVALGVSLLSAVPAGSPATVKAAAKKLRGSVVTLQSAWGAAATPTPSGKKRAADSASDNAWGCLESRLAGYARLPASEYPKVARASAIHSALFPDGLAFLTLPYKAQWAEGGQRLKRIDEQGYSDDINDIAGAEFLKEVKKTHEVYGKVLGVTQAEELPLDIRLTDPLRAVGQAIVDYALQLLAHASADASAAASVRKALKPIDDQRAASARRAASAGDAASEQGGEPEATPKTPVPEVPA
jgi:hypothetical protein